MPQPASALFPFYTEPPVFDRSLMSGEDMVSGSKNKAMVAAGNVMPEQAVAAQMDKMQEPRDKEDAD